MRLLILLLFAVFSTHAKVPPAQPNFILIMADNLGYGDIGPFGSKLHRTPNLDRMAREGRRLTSFYSASGVCTPRRAALCARCAAPRHGPHGERDGADPQRAADDQGASGGLRAASPTPA